MHVATWSAHRWVQRLLPWQLVGARRLGRPRHTWESNFHACCMYANLGHWRGTALDDIFCNSYVDWISENVLQVPSFGVPMGCYTSDFPKNSCSVLILRPRFVRDADKLYTHWNVKSKLAGPSATLARRTQTSE